MFSTKHDQQLHLDSLTIFLNMKYEEKTYFDF